MKMNRVQFQPGLSMPEFYERYGTEAQCRAALQASRWPNGFFCPACGGAARTSFERGGLRYWQCGACAHQCSLISGTIFEASKLPLTRWFLAMQLLTQSKNNVSALELMRQLGVCYRSAWLIKHKIMEAMRLRESGRELTGRVEMDTPTSAESARVASPAEARRTRCPSSQQFRLRPAASQSSRACASSPIPKKRLPSSPPATSRLRPPSSPTGCGASARPPSWAPSMSATSPAAAKPA